MESLSGVKAHTLRIWEKRYNIMEPKRTETNIRYYTDEDLRHLLNVCLLYRHGHKISKIACMTEEEIRNHVDDLSQLDFNLNDKLDSLLLYILQLDSYSFNKVLDKHIKYDGMQETMENMIYPLMDKLSIAWLSGSFQDVHESFVSQIIKCKIMSEIEKIEEKKDASPSYIIYLPKAEKQELSLMYLHYQLKYNGCQVINLGNDVSLNDVILAISSRPVDYVFTILNEEMSTVSLQEYISEICTQLGEKTFLVTGYQTLRLGSEKPDNLKILNNLSETLDLIKGHNRNSTA